VPALFISSRGIYDQAYGFLLMAGFPEVMAGTISFFARIIVRGPGQKASISLKAFSGMFLATFSTSSLE